MNPRLADREARRRAASGQLSAHRHRSCRHGSAALSRPGWRGATRTGGSTSSTISRKASAQPIVHTAISRSIIDVNRDPSGASLYPGQTTTGLCPTETFDGDPLYGSSAPNRGRRRSTARQVESISSPIMRRLQPGDSRGCGRCTRLVVLYDCHSIRSVLPRLFEGTLPVFNLGTNDGKSADPAAGGHVAAYHGGQRRELRRQRPLQGRLDHAPPRHGRKPASMRCRWSFRNRGYMREPEGKGEPSNWPTPYDPDYAAPMRATLTDDTRSRPCLGAPVTAQSILLR